MAGSPYLEEFTRNFDRACMSMKLSSERAQSARSAIRELFSEYEPTAQFSLPATPYFASHGPDHGVRLSQVATSILETLRPETSQWKQMASAEFLVLLFGALLLHDIGMAIPPRTSPSNGNSIQKSQLVRKDHDERSLEFIENVLHCRQLHAWHNFWEKTPTGVWPTPTGTHALRLLARLCKSHGDSADVWLKQDSLDSYQSRTSSEVFNLAHTWGHTWDAGIRPMALAAATLLSLCDLCDIDGGRFRDLPGKWKDYWLPEDIDQLRMSFIHWSGHQLASLKASSKAVELSLPSYNGSKMSDLYLLSHGPAADLFKWGNAQQLIAAVREYVDSDYNGVAIIDGPAKDGQWKHVQAISTNEQISPCALFPDLNSVLFRGEDTPERFHASFTLPMWWMSAVRHWKADIPDDGSGSYFVLRLLARLRDAGLLIEDLMELPANTDFSNYVFSVSPPVTKGKQGAGRLHEMADSFLAAIHVAREIASLCPKECRSVRFAFRGNSVFSTLTAGKLDSLRNTIVLCEVRDKRGAERQEYRDIANAFAEAGESASARLVFFGTANGLEAAGQPSWTTVQPTASENGLQLLRGRQLDFAEQGPEQIAVRVLGEIPAAAGDVDVCDVCPTAALVHIFLRSNVNKLGDLIASYLANQDSAEVPLGLGLATYIILLDLLDLGDGRISSQAARIEYEQLSREVSYTPLVDWSEVTQNAANARLIAEDSDYIIVKRRPEVRSLRTQITSNCGLACLAQVAILYRWWALGQPYNLGAGVLLQEPISTRMIGRIIAFVSDQKASEEARVNMAVFLGLELAKQVYDGKWEFTEAIRCVVPNLNDGRLSFEDLIVFQIVYRIANINLQHLTSGAVKPFMNSSIAILGILEAIASARGAHKPVVMDVVKLICGKFAGQLKKSPNKWLPAVFAYDIVWKYSRITRKVRSAAGDLLTVGRSRGMDRMAAYFHAIGSSGDASAIRRKPGPDWKRVRADFLRITNQLTPADQSRQKVAPEVLGRAMSV